MLAMSADSLYSVGSPTATLEPRQGRGVSSRPWVMSGNSNQYVAMLKVKPLLLCARLAQMLIFAAITIANFGAAATVGLFTGGDPGEGLDLQGNFVYAVDVGPSGAGGKVGDAVFTADDVAGVTITTTHSIAPPGWVDPTYGET